VTLSVTITNNLYALKPFLGKTQLLRMRSDLSVISIFDGKSGRDWSPAVVERAFYEDGFFDEDEKELWSSHFGRRGGLAPQILRGTAFRPSYKRLLKEHLHVHPADIGFSEGGIIFGRHSMLQLTLIPLSEDPVPVDVFYGRIKQIS